MNETSLEILKLLVQAGVLLMAAYVLPALRKRFMAGMDEKTYQIIRQAVYSVQQLYWADPGNKRKQICIELATEMLGNAGIRISSEQISVLIEAAVQEMHIAKGDYKKEKA